MSEPLRQERHDGIVILTLDRASRGNAIDVAMADALLGAALDCGSDTKVRAVILTGAGPMFCSGGDVGAFAEAGDTAPALMHRLTAPLHAAITRLLHMDVPLVTAINGAAAGAGFGLALLGDVALAARSAKFSMAYGAIGLTPDAGTTWLLPRLVGLRQAQRLALAGERIDAEEAARIGVVTRVVDDAKLLQEAITVAGQLGRYSPTAFRATRDLLISSMESGLETHLAREADSIAKSAAHIHGREGIAAFAEKRRPNFV